MTKWTNPLNKEEMRDYADMMIERNALKSIRDKYLAEDDSEYDDELLMIQEKIDKFNLDHGMQLHDWERDGK